MATPLAYPHGYSLRCVHSSRQHQSSLFAETSMSKLRRLQERWYIFDHKQVHSLAQRAIANNPNNTRGVIDEIVSSLSESHGAAINKREEWFFNNAGGAMGSMFIIHGPSSLSLHFVLSEHGVLGNSQYNGVPHHLRYTARNGRSFR